MTRAMDMLAENERVRFIGQAVRYPGTAMSTTLANVPMHQLIEMPVCEEMQMGMSIGLAIHGWIPVSIFTRWNFLLLAANQIVNHLDKLAVYSDYRPKVIVRTGIGSEHPMHPGPQHTGDFTAAFASICPSIHFEILEMADQIMPAYRAAVDRDGSSVLVERSDLYNG